MTRVPRRWAWPLHWWSPCSSERLGGGICGRQFSFKTEEIICEIAGTPLPWKPASRRRHSPCTHYLPITGQLPRSHSSRLQIRTVLEAYSSASRLREAQEESRAISPPGQCYTHTTGDGSGQQQPSCFFFSLMGYELIMEKTKLNYRPVLVGMVSFMLFVIHVGWEESCSLYGGREKGWYRMWPIIYCH